VVFSSLVFLYAFLPLNLICYFICKNQTYRNWVLIFFSLAFYAWGEPVWIGLLIVSSLIIYLLALTVEKHRGERQSKVALVSAITISLSLLGFFKYWDFLVHNLSLITGISIPLHNLGLPIGISFFTFKAISYIVDVYRGEVRAQQSFPKFLLYISLFHHLVAGPIVRYKDVAAAIEHREFSRSQFNEGINRFVTGLGKKVILANTAGETADLFLQGDLSALPVLGAWFGIILYAMHIYLDFSAYSDMAIGLGKIFGFNYQENFNYPYISRSATEFWRRWHISLGSFFRDYVYIPLGGNRIHHLRNLFIVWFLTGLWHGASWNFVLWGVYYGILIALEKVCLSKILKKLPHWIAHTYLIFAVLIGWVFFYYPDLQSIGDFFQAMFGFGSRELINTQLKIYFSNNLLLFIIALMACTPITKLIRKALHYLTDKSTRTAFLYGEALLPSLNFVLLILATIMLVGKSYSPFLYFNF